MSPFVLSWRLPSRWRRSALLLTVGLAFVLRVYRLGYQSLWSDEGWTVAFSSQDVSSIVTFVDPDHSPLYYLLLGRWMALAGQSEFSVRFLSLGFGVLLVPLTWALGRRLSGGLLGLVAAFLVAIAPFLVYYSQEARMHILASFFGLLSTYLFVRAIEGRRWHHWLGYGLASSIALSLFFYTALLLVAQATYFLLFLRRRGELVGGWLLSQLLVMAVGAGWAARNLLPLTEFLEVRSYGLQSLPLAEFLSQSGVAFSLGPTVEGGGVGILLSPFVVLLLVGGGASILRLREGGPRVPEAASRWGLLPLTLLVVPVAGSYLLNLWLPHFLPRYLLWVTPFYYLILAQGLCRWGEARRSLPGGLGLAAWGGLLAIIVASAISLGNNYYDPHFARDDYRSLARYIESEAHPQDAIILNASWQAPTFDYYYRGGQDRYGLPAQFPLDEGLTASSLADIIRRHRGLWLLLYGSGGSDPNDFVEGWLNGCCRRIEEDWYGRVRLVRYQVPLPASFDPSQLAHRLGLRVGERIELLGYELDSSLAQGEPLYLTLYWRALGGIEKDYTVFVHLLDEEGRRWAQRDGQPLNGGYPTSAWRPMEVIRDGYRLEVAPQAPPGQYHLEVGMYLLSSMERLPFLDGEGGIVGEVARLGPVTLGEGDAQ